MREHRGVERRILSEQRREQVLDVLRTGEHQTLGSAAKAAGITQSALSNARRGDVDFKKLSDQLLAMAKGTYAAPVDEEFPDFMTWRERFMGYYLDSGPVRAQTYEFHRQAYEAVEANNRLVMLVPPYHMKTSTWSIEYSTYLIMKNRNVRILVVQKSGKEAKKIIRAVQERLTSHEFYQGLGIPIEEDPITLYGGRKGFKPDKYGGEGKWGAEEFTVSGVKSGEKDYTMQAVGATSGVLSIRSDLIICDDIQAPTQRTQDITHTLVEDLIHQSLVTRLGRDSKLFILGSRLGTGDIYERILSEEWAEDWPVIKFPAILDEDEQTTLLPELWPYDALMKRKKEVGPQTWATSYMQEEGDAAGAVFVRERMEEAKNREQIMGTPPPEVTHIYLGHDPAVVNWNVIVVWGLDRRTKKRYLIDELRHSKLGTWDKAVDMLYEVAIKYSPRVVVIETNNTQSHVYNTARERLSGIGTVVKEYKTATGMGQQAHDMDFSISSMGALYDQGLVSLPYGDDASRRMTDAYIDEFCRWHTTEEGHSIKDLVRDRVMATQFAESEARKEARREFDQIRQRQPKRKWASNGDGGWRWQRQKPA